MKRHPPQGSAFARPAFPGLPQVPLRVLQPIQPRQGFQSKPPGAGFHGIQAQHQTGIRLNRFPVPILLRPSGTLQEPVQAPHAQQALQARLSRSFQQGIGFGQTIKSLVQIAIQAAQIRQ